MHEQPPQEDVSKKGQLNNIVKKIDDLNFPEKDLNPLDLDSPRKKEKKFNLEKIDILSEPEIPEGDESKG